MITWQQYIRYVKKYTAFSQHEVMQLAGLAIFIFMLYFMYHAQLYDWKVSLIRTPRKFFIAAWTAFIIGMTLINRHGVASEVMYFNPMIGLKSVLSGNAFSQYQIISNILLFIPYGFLIPWNVWYCRRWWCCALVCTGSSLMIEIEQQMTRRGDFDTSDLLTNLIGAMVGFLIYWLEEKGRYVIKTRF